MRITPLLIGLLMIPVSAASAAEPVTGPAAIVGAGPLAVAIEATQTAIPAVSPLVTVPGVAVTGVAVLGVAGGTVTIDTENMDDADLTELRGGESRVLGNQTLLAVSQGNSIGGNYAAGNVTLSDNALSNFAGIGNVVINTGAQANLQAGMNLIINLVP